MKLQRTEELLSKAKRLVEAVENGEMTKEVARRVFMRYLRQAVNLQELANSVAKLNIKFGDLV